MTVPLKKIKQEFMPEFMDDEFKKSFLSEIGNMGAGHAAIALSQMLGKKISIAVTQVQILGISDFRDMIGDEGKLLCGVYLKVLGDVQGVILLCFEREAALRLADILLGNPPQTTKILTEIEQSALKEVGSIMAASYLGAISKFLETVLLPSVPTMAFDTVDKIFDSVFNELSTRRDNFVIGIENEFIEAETRIKGYFLYMPAEMAMEQFFKLLEQKKG